MDWFFFSFFLGISLVEYLWLFSAGINSERLISGGEDSRAFFVKRVIFKSLAFWVSVALTAVSLGVLAYLLILEVELSNTSFSAQASVVLPAVFLSIIWAGRDFGLNKRGPNAYGLLNALYRGAGRLGFWSGLSSLFPPYLISYLSLIVLAVLAMVVLLVRNIVAHDPGWVEICTLLGVLDAMAIVEGACTDAFFSSFSGRDG